MKVLVTGANGFVGRHLTPLLQASGYRVYSVVRKPSGSKNEIAWDLKDQPSTKLPDCDFIVHLAAHVDFSKNICIDPYLVNTISTAVLAKHSNESGAVFILASMTGIHGNSGNFSISSSIAPANNYALSKFLAEQITCRLSKNAYILRIAGIYGLDGPKHLALNKSISDAYHRKNSPILHGSGLGKRNYICVKDVAKWIHNLIENDNCSRQPESDSFIKILYLTGKEVKTIREYLKDIVDVLCPNNKIISKPGSAIQDCIVKGSPAPFRLTSFKEYLLSLKS